MSCRWSISAATPSRVEHLPRIIALAIGVDELAAGQAGQRRDQAVVARKPVERDVVDVAHEMVRIDIVMLHQPGERGA